MCKCNRVAGIIATGVFTVIGLAIYITALSFKGSVWNYDEVDPLNASVLIILTVNKIVTIAIQIYFAAVQTVAALNINWIAYVVTAVLEFAVIIMWISVLGAECGMRCGEGAVVVYYIWVGAGLFGKIITNGVSAWNLY